MENLKVKELIEICEELVITLDRAKQKQAILEIMRDEGVSAEEVDEAWADIKAAARRPKGEKLANVKKLKGEKFANVR